MRERADPTAVRRTNLGVIVRRLNAAGPMSRARAGLGHRPQQVDGLEPRGRARRPRAGARGAPTPDGRRASGGRRRRSCSARATVAVGAEIAVDGLAVCLEDLTGAVRLRGAPSTSTCAQSSPATVLQRLAALVARTCCTRAQADGLRVVGVGVAVPGLVDVASGTLLRAPNLGWTRVADRRGAGRPARPARRAGRRRERGQPVGAGRALGRRGPAARRVHPRHRRGRRRRRHRHRRGAVPRRARLRRRARPRDRRPGGALRLRRARLPGDGRRRRGDPRARRASWCRPELGEYAVAAAPRRARRGTGIAAAIAALDGPATRSAWPSPAPSTCSTSQCVILGGSFTPLAPVARAARARRAVDGTCWPPTARRSTCAPSALGGRRRHARRGGRPPAVGARPPVARGPQRRRLRRRVRATAVGD